MHDHDNCNLLFFTDSQLAGHEATGSHCCQSLHPERLHQRHCVPVPDQVPLRAGDQGRVHLFTVFLMTCPITLTHLCHVLWMS